MNSSTNTETILSEAATQAVAERAETIPQGSRGLVTSKREESKAKCDCGMDSVYASGLCRKCYSREYHSRNREKLNADAKLRSIRWYRHNRDLVLAQRRARYHNDPEYRKQKRDRDFRAKYGGNGFRALKQAGFRCSVCGFGRVKEILEVHHLDSNRKNNAFANLKPLCPNCHREAHLGL